MRKSWINLAVALTILVGSSPYPALAQSSCGTFGHHFIYWDFVDPQGNCPPNRTTIIGENFLDCDGTSYSWGSSTGFCEAERYWWYCGDCYPEG